MPISGRNGHIAKGVETPDTAIGCVSAWNAEVSEEAEEMYCSASKGAPVQYEGTGDWSGSFARYGADLSVLPGDKIQFAGAAKGSGASAKGISGPVIIDSVAITIDIEGGKVVSESYNFSGNGAYTIGTINCPADGTTPDPVLSKDCKLYLGTVAASPVYTLQADVRTITITLTRANLEYVSSSTNGFKGRDKGKISATLSFTVFADETSPWDNCPMPGEYFAAKVTTNTAEDEFWELKWLKCNTAPLDVDIEGDSLIGGTSNLSFTGYAKDSEGDSIEGGISVIGTTVWPES